MFKSRKKLATLAVAAAMSGGAMMVASSAHALNVSQHNLGEVLFFPYYTVKNGLDTVFTVTNTTNKTAIFKVRFREALNSREVRDFNVILSPYDHWGAAVTGDGAGGALVRTFDKTCTSPILPASATIAGAREIGFTNYLYTSGSATLTPGGVDGGGTGIDRVQEGYFEVFLMGVSTGSTTVSTNTVEYNAKHVSGTPRDCAKVDAAFLSAPGSATVAGTPFSLFSAPEDILKGHVMYINVANGQAIDAEPTAIEHWLDGSAKIYAPGDLLPSLAQGDQTSAEGFAAALNSTGYSKAFTNSQNAATAVLSADSVINEYASGTGAATSWVVTFPTKHHYTDDGLTSVLPPFKELFVKASTATNYGKSCDTVSVTLFDREENSVQPSGTAFSPVQTSAGVQLCYEANVVDFNGSTVFGAGVNHLGMSTTAVGTAGWARLGLTNTGNVGGVTTVTGLPAIGFSAFMRTNSSVSTNYGSSAAHSFEPGHH